MWGRLITAQRARLARLLSVLSRNMVKGWRTLVSIAQGIVWILGAILTVLGIMYSHRLSFELDADRSKLPDPFDVSATITNAGIIPLQNVNIEIGVCFINAGWRIGTFDPKTGLKIPESKCADPLEHFVRLGVQKWSGHRLGVDEKYQIRLIDGLLEALQATPENRPTFGRFTTADLTIIIEYRSFLLFNQTKYFRLHAERQSDDTVVWQHLTIDKR